MHYPDYIALIKRAMAAIETPGDLTDEERTHLVEDLSELADEDDAYGLLCEDHDLVLPIAGGGFITTDGEKREYGAQVNVFSPTGIEVQVWDCKEWERDPELVMGAFLAVAFETTDY